jgi:hypothetical protein
MVFAPEDRSVTYVARGFLSFKFNSVQFLFVNSFYYLCHVITCCRLSDDVDKQREIKSMLVRTNIFTYSKFAKCPSTANIICFDLFMSLFLYYFPMFVGKCLVAFEQRWHIR